MVHELPKAIQSTGLCRIWSWGRASGSSNKECPDPGSYSRLGLDPIGDRSSSGYPPAEPCAVGGTGKPRLSWVICQNVT